MRQEQRYYCILSKKSEVAASKKGKARTRTTDRYLPDFRVSRRGLGNHDRAFPNQNNIPALKPVQL